MSTSVFDSKRFEKLRRAFQKGHLRSETKPFAVFALTSAEYRELTDFPENRRTSKFRMPYHLGYVPGVRRDGVEDGYVIATWTKWAILDCVGDCEDFLRLSRWAGVMLPTKIRSQLPGEPVQPNSIWLSFLWKLFPPTSDVLRIDTAKTGEPRLLFDSDTPFEVSARAIDVCGLNTSKPHLFKRPPGRPRLSERNDDWYLQWKACGEPSITAFAKSLGMGRSRVSRAFSDARLRHGSQK